MFRNFSTHLGRRLSSAALALSVVALAVPAQAQQAEMKPSRLFDLAKPGTVMVQTNYRVQIDFPDAQFSQAQLQVLQVKIIQQVRSGQIPATQQAVVRAIVEEILARPLQYLIPAATGTFRKKTVNMTSTGSGFVLTPDGYVVTNAHVVAPDEKEMKSQLVRIGLQDVIAQDAKEFIQEAGGAATQDLVDKLKQAALQFYLNYMRVGDVNKQVFVATGVTVPGVTVTQKGHPAEIAAAGESIPGKDVAILNIEGTNLPTLPMGDESALNTGDKLYVVGYPGAATFHPLLSQSSLVEPTFTDGVVSAKKQMAGGWSVLQTSADMTHGNSGGPVLDSRGNVIGLATFGSIDQNTGQEVAGMNFVVPVSVVKEFLGRINVKGEESIVTKKYREALEKSDKQYYKSALAIFREIDALQPGHPYVEEQMQKSQSAIMEGKDQSWKEMLPLIIGGVAVLFFLFVGFVALLVMLLRRKPKPAVAAAPAGTGGPQAPGGGQQYMP